MIRGDANQLRNAGIVWVTDRVEFGNRFTRLSCIDERAGSSQGLVDLAIVRSL
jgi:hypothetical protein